MFCRHIVQGWDKVSIFVRLFVSVTPPFINCNMTQQWHGPCGLMQLSGKFVESHGRVYDNTKQYHEHTETAMTLSTDISVFLSSAITTILTVVVFVKDSCCILLVRVVSENKDMQFILPYTTQQIHIISKPDAPFRTTGSVK